MENVLEGLDGVVNAEADYRQGIATVTYIPEQVTPQQMVDAINDQTFFQASLPEVSSASSEQRTGGTRWGLVVPVALLLIGGLALLWRSRGGLPRVRLE